MNEKSKFIIDYLLARAGAVTGSFDPMSSFRMANKLWNEVNKVTPSDKHVQN